MKTLKAVAAKYNATSLILRIVIGLVVGAVLALAVPGAGWVEEFGSLFVGALKGIAPVLVFVIVASALAQGSSLNAVTVTENDFGYVTFTARQTGDPYLNYIGGTSTKVGRWLLVKYNNHSVIPRMQLYMAQGAGITSDNNMIEFPIAANGSGWTYVIVDMATNQFYDKGVNKAEFKTMLQLLSPFAPHMADELWERFGFEGMACTSRWPVYDESKTVASEVTIAVQVGGKLKTTVTVPTDSEQDAVLAVVTADSKIQKLMEGKDLVKVIHVPNKLMNLILKPKA